MDSQPRNGAIEDRLVAASCIVVICVILIFGLWPFHAPTNEVTWFRNENGLWFGLHGSVVSSGEFLQRALNDETSCSLEIWLEPSITNQSGTILAFDGSAHPGAPFSFHQDKDAARIERHNIDSYGTVRTSWFNVDGVFREKRPVLVTITLGKRDTSVYLDGALVKVAPMFGISASNFTGHLVVANSAIVNDSWSGRVLGLALYDRQLSAAQVEGHYQSWIRNGRPVVAEDAAQIALYLFNERNGNIVLDKTGRSTGLLIPARYFVRNPPFLTAVWDQYRFGIPGWSYWADVATNIVGFIPLGFFLAIYLSSLRQVKRSTVTVIILGFLLSLTIETLQTYLPTRDSDMTDVISNTAGAAFGVMLSRCSMARAVWSSFTATVVSSFELWSRPASGRVLDRQDEEIRLST